MSIHTIPRPGTTYPQPYAEIANEKQYGVGRVSWWTKLKEMVK